MATIASVSVSAAASQIDDIGIASEIRIFWRQFILAAFSPYRPEQHYMRGPGPACAAKQINRG